MKKLLALVLSLVFLGILTPAGLRAETVATSNRKHQRLLKGRPQLKSKMLGKYDSNKDGKLDRTERSKISKKDRRQLRKARSIARHRKARIAKGRRALG